ncbi:MAG: peptidase [Microvirga sp.]|jgi:antitoxin MazE|nr:peptidase [Microvirga sp.]
MRTKLVRVGNSKGVRLPKAILEQSGITDEVDLKVEEGRVILMRPERHPREGWAEDARRMVQNGDDVDPFEGATGLNSWDEKGWTWPEDHPWPEESDVMTPISSPSTRSRGPK